MKQTYEKLMASGLLKKARELMKADEAHTWEQHQELVLIPAFSRHEELRSKRFAEMLRAEGCEVTVDEVNNVYTTIKGAGDGPTVYMTAHIDTVFPMETPLAIRKEGERYYCPGIGDDTAQLAQILTLVRVIRDSGVRFKGDLIIGGNVGEEGLGDLYGVRHFFSKKENADLVDGFITFDGSSTGIVTGGTGSYRYKVSFKGPGGHSYGDFGMPNPILAMGRAIALFAEMKPPKTPKTTFSVGVVEGGTSVNSIPFACSMLVDMRSEGKASLDAEDARFKEVVAQAVEEENARWINDRELYSDRYSRPGAVPLCEKKVEAVIEQLGNRPVGELQPDDSPIVAASVAAFKAVGIEPSMRGCSSTDANIPISMGIPAVGMGGGGKGGGAHSAGEWFDPTDITSGLFKNYVLLCGLLGVEGLTEPLLPKRDK
ncbi:MAG: M20/M25/M40 family metallo-hydrolase [Firmicutes bacterium]|nr:M20/M25/M40 family metallo-hydrolase [Bacillota bacterium]